MLIKLHERKTKTSAIKDLKEYSNTFSFFKRY